MNRLLLTLILTALTVTVNICAQGTVADEGAWCWFADPRALHYENTSGTVNATYIGYIDVHGNVCASQYNWLTHHKTDVLVRSCFQPDDHNNPTFLVLPDERIMIFYTRHTDEPRIWYRISVKPGDISNLGEEKFLATENNTTYPSPFIMSDDPSHIYLCWRGINWHPTIARLTVPDADGNCHFDFEPRQVVQSTGARPYAKYLSNGRDKIYLCYTTGHPDNEQPNWLYFNVIDINHGQGPILRDLNGSELSRIQDKVFRVDKSQTFAAHHPATIVDNTPNVRNWVWQLALDANEHPVVAYTHIDNAKTTHDYRYARWNGNEWQSLWLQHGGHAFHNNWNSTERCYSGGMAIDPDSTSTVYLSVPTSNGSFDRDGQYELWRTTVDSNLNIAQSKQVTHSSRYPNARPYVIPGSSGSPLRLVWMQGDYYYWMVNRHYPKGYPTAIVSDYMWQETSGQSFSKFTFQLDADHYSDTLFTAVNKKGKVIMTYAISPVDQHPELTVKGRTYRSQNRLMTSDDWALHSNGTNGDSHPTPLNEVTISLGYDGRRLTILRNDKVDQVILVRNLPRFTIKQKR